MSSGDSTKISRYVDDKTSTPFSVQGKPKNVLIKVVFGSDNSFFLCEVIPFSIVLAFTK